MKKKTLLTSILTIVMCLSLTVGATFALFTSKSEVNIAVSSATVDVKAIASELDTDIAYGSATKNGNEITVERMLPGDSFSFDIAIENYSDVAVQYRTVISNTDGGLFKALKITITEDKEQRVYNGGYVYEDWALLTPSDVDATTADNVRNINVLVEFPDTGVAQDEYQGKACTMKILVEAVQGNATVVNPLTKINDRHYEVNSAEGMMLIDGILSSMDLGEGKGIKFELTDSIDMSGRVWTPINKMWVEFDGNGKTISNLTCETAWRSGFFGYLGGGSIVDLVLENVTAEGTQAGIVAGSVEGSLIQNVTIKGNNSVKFNQEANSGETWGGVGAVAGVAQPIKAGSNITIEGNVTVDYNGLVTEAPYGSVNALITNIDEHITTNGTVTVKDRYIQYVADGFGLDKDGNYLVLSKTGLESFASLVNSGDTFKDKTVILDSNINLEGINWTPIGLTGDQAGFQGTFDGNNKTIFNLTVNNSTRAYQSAGLFGSARYATIKNFTINGANIYNLDVVGNSSNGAAVVVGSSQFASTIDNVDVVDATVTGNRRVAAIVGYFKGTVTNCDVVNATITAIFDESNGEYDNCDKVGGIIGYVNTEGVISKNTIKDSTIKGYRDVGGIVGHGGEITENTVENVTINLDDAHNYKNYTSTDEYDLGLIVGEGTADASNVAINSIVNFGATSVVTSAETIQQALGNGATNLVLGSDINLNEALTFAAGTNVNFDISNKTITAKAGEYAIIAEAGSSVTIGSSAPVTYSRSAVNGGTIVGTIYNQGELIINSGTFNAAEGESYLVLNYKGNLTINGGTFNAGSSYPIYSFDEGNKLVINNAIVNATFGCVNVYGNKSTAEINGGVFNMTGVQGKSSHIAYFSNAEVTINGGSFNKIGDISMSATGGGGICVIYGAKLTINGGYFSGDYADVYNWGGNHPSDGTPVAIEIKGGSYKFKAIEDLITNDYLGTIENDGQYLVTVKPEVADEIEKTLAEGGTVELEDDYFPVASSAGYSKAGLSHAGGTIDGKGNTISASNSDGTWDCTIYTNGGTIKNATVSGGFRGIFTAGLNQDLYIENVIFDDVTYTFSADNGNVNYGVYFTDCVLNGWTSFTNKFKEVVFTDCTFGEGRGYAYCRPYNQTKFVGCHFEEGFAIDGSRNILHFENCTFGADKTPLTIDNYKELISGFVDGTSINGVKYVATLAGLQKAIDNAVNGDVIAFLAEIKGDVTVVQKQDVAFTIDGAGYTFNGVINVNGKSARYATAGLKIQNVNFNADGISEDACIRLGLGTDNSTRYTNNVTVYNCTFSGTNEKVAVKSYTGGDYNVVLEKLTVNAGMHSLAQLQNVEKGLKIIDCKVYSKNGANLNSTEALEMSGCTFDVKGYAIRFGVNGSVNTTEKIFNIANSTLKSACDDGDAVIIFRDNSKFATLTLTNVTLEGSLEMSGNTNQTTIVK